MPASTKQRGPPLNDVGTETEKIEPEKPWKNPRLFHSLMIIQSAQRGVCGVD